MIESLIEVGRAGILRFYNDLRRTPGLVDRDGPLGYLHDATAEEVPISQDGNCVPRIEIREEGSAVVFVGVPSSLGSQYFEVPPALAHAVDGRPTGRVCFDCVPKGLDKSLVVSHLLCEGVLVPGRTVALGDQPAGNDEGLTRWHHGGAPGVDIPFVSVSERKSMVPERLQDCHLTVASNAEGSAILLDKLAEQLATDAELHLSSLTVCTMVDHLNGQRPPCSGEMINSSAAASQSTHTK